jgi:hypothetical protein
MHTQFKENLDYIKKLETQLTALTSQVSNYQSLDLNLLKKQEEINTLQKQVLDQSHLRQQLASLECENNTLLKQKKEWFLVYFLIYTRSDYCYSNQEHDPVQMARALTRERLHVAQLKQEMGIEAAQKAGREQYITQCESEIESLKKNIIQLNMDMENTRQQVHLESRKRKIQERRVESLTEQLVSLISYLYSNRRVLNWKNPFT